jgi:hypothetical protein
VIGNNIAEALDFALDRSRLRSAAVFRLVEMWQDGRKCTAARYVDQRLSFDRL